MKIDISKAKKWVILNIEWQLYRLIDHSFTSMQQRAGTYTLRLKNILTWWTVNQNFKSWTVLDTADVNTKNAIFLYNNWTTYSFMENDNSEIYDLEAEDIDDVIPYLKENLDVFLMIYEGKVLWVILPTVVSYKVIETVPWVKWDRARAGKKPWKLETWLEIMIPLHINEWDEVKVNTATGETV